MVREKPPVQRRHGVRRCRCMARWPKLGRWSHTGGDVQPHKEVWNVVALVGGVVGLAVGGPWRARELRSLPRPQALAARSGQRIVTLQVGGMTCGGCAAAVQTRLAALSGVSTVDVRYQQGRAYVVCDRAVA